MLFMMSNDLDFLDTMAKSFIIIVGNNVFTFISIAFVGIINAYLATRRKTVKLRAHNKVI